ncbi:MAG: hypothetical protein DWQ05_05035 [Calditrichaeota bacterium]|nr:MAG: hypothetical protein DWQ05_05035 [Calditrichota bacterium]
MKKLLSIFVLLNFAATLVLPDILKAAANRFKIHNVAVLSIKPKGDLNSDDALLLTSELERRLGEINFIQTLSMKAANKKLSDYCVSLQCAVRIGRSMNANFVVYGIIHQIDDYFACDFRMANVSTGKLIGSASYKFDCDFESMLDQMRNIGRKLVGLKTSLNMPLSSRSLTEVKNGKRNKNRKKKVELQPVETFTSQAEPAAPVETKPKNVDEITWDDAAYDEPYDAVSKNNVPQPEKSDAGNSSINNTDRPQTKKPVPSQTDAYLNSITWDMGEEDDTTTDNAPEEKYDPGIAEKTPVEKSSAPAETKGFADSPEKDLKQREKPINSESSRVTANENSYESDDFGADWDDAYAVEDTKNKPETTENPAQISEKSNQRLPQVSTENENSKVVDTFDQNDFGVDDFSDSVPEQSIDKTQNIPDEPEPVDNTDPFLDNPETGVVDAVREDTNTTDDAALQETQSFAPVNQKLSSSTFEKTQASIPEKPTNTAPVSNKLIEITWDDDKELNKNDVSGQFDNYEIDTEDRYSPITDDRVTESSSSENSLSENIWANYRSAMSRFEKQSQTNSSTGKENNDRRIADKSGQIQATDSFDDNSFASESNTQKSTSASLAEIFPAYSENEQTTPSATPKSNSAAQTEILADDGFPQAEFLTGEEENTQAKPNEEKSARQFKVGKWSVYSLIATGVGTGIFFAAKNLGKGNGSSDNGPPLPTPPDFLGDD